MLHETMEMYFLLPNWDLVTWIQPSSGSQSLAPWGPYCLVCHRPLRFRGTSRHEFVTFALNKCLQEFVAVVSSTHFSPSVLSSSPLCSSDSQIDRYQASPWAPVGPTCWISQTWHGPSHSLDSFHPVLPIPFTGITGLLVVGPETLVSSWIRLFLLTPHPAHQMVSSFTSLSKIHLNQSISHHLCF